MPKPSPVQITRIAKLLRLAMDPGAAEPEAMSAIRHLRSYLENEGLSYGDIFTEPRKPKPVRRRPTGNMHVHVYGGPFTNSSTSTGGFWTQGA